MIRTMSISRLRAKCKLPTDKSITHRIFVIKVAKGLRLLPNAPRLPFLINTLIKHQLSQATIVMSTRCRSTSLLIKLNFACSAKFYEVKKNKEKQFLSIIGLSHRTARAINSILIRQLCDAKDGSKLTGRREKCFVEIGETDFTIEKSFSAFLTTQNGWFIDWMLHSRAASKSRS